MFHGIVAYWLESLSKRPCLSCVTDIHASLSISEFSSKNVCIDDHSIFGHSSGYEKKTFRHALKHGTNLVWLAFHDPGNHKSSVIL